MSAVCKRIKPVDIAPLIGALHGMSFVAANIGSTNPQRSPCSVALGKSPAPVTAFVESLGLGGETKRILFRKLAPRQGMAPHIDNWMGDEAEWRRFHVPVVSHPDIRMRWPDDGVDVHLEPGWLWEVRFDRLHEVVHGADCERVHLQIDQVNATI